MSTSEMIKKGGIMAQFDDAKVGDRVWSFIYGWGKVSKIHTSGQGGYDFQVVFPFDCEFEDNICNYYWDGTQLEIDLNPTLFWDEVKIDPPERPSRCKECGGITPREGWICAECHMDAISKQLEEEECEACERLKKFDNIPGVIEAVFWDIKWLLTLPQHHTCEKGK